MTERSKRKIVKWLESIDIVIEVRGASNVRRKKDEFSIEAYGWTTVRIVPRGKVDLKEGEK